MGAPVYYFTFGRKRGAPRRVSRAVVYQHRPRQNILEQVALARTPDERLLGIIGPVDEAPALTASHLEHVIEEREYNRAHQKLDKLPPVTGPVVPFRHPFGIGLPETVVAPGVNRYIEEAPWEEGLLCRNVQMGAFPVTNREFWQVVALGGHMDFPLSCASEELAHLPVTRVTLEQAQLYCCTLSEVTGWQYDLPYVLEWEMAAGRFSGRRFPWGHNLDERKVACSIKGRMASPVPVLLFEAGQTSAGLMHMSGNVWEMAIAGEVGREVEAVLKGGSFRTNTWNMLEIAAKVPWHAQLPDDNIGFRVVKVMGED